MKKLIQDGATDGSLSNASVHRHIWDDQNIKATFSWPNRTW